jgi:aconitate hydratase
MAKRESLTYRILREHLVSGELEPGKKIAVRIDQTLTQDATGTMAYLQFEALGVPRVRTGLSVSYVDHNTLQTDFMNADDHRYLQSVAAKYGVLFSRAGNGICHQVHLERFGAPGTTLLGSDSHTPTAGGLGALAMGAGGLDVALAMAGEPFSLTAPEVVGVMLTGALPPWVSAKDVILELLRRLSVKGGVGRVFEYFGPGVRALSVPERATITNMGAELGATTSLFPSDRVTAKFLEAQGRGDAWRDLEAGTARSFARVEKIDLATLAPLAAAPHSPDAVRTVESLAGTPVQQVCIGSCTNSSYRDLMTVAAVLRGRRVHPGVSLTISPGSRQVLAMIAANGALADLVGAGARILESTCGPCIGMGQAPSTGAVSLRTFNRNFKGRSGTKDASVYLVSPETAAASAVAGSIADPRGLGEAPRVKAPRAFLVDDGMIVPAAPAADAAAVEILRGPNIQPLPEGTPLPDNVEGEVLIVVGDDITTDHIMPAGAKVLPLRSNIPAIAEFVFAAVDPAFPARAKAAGTGFVVGGRNYGQGSSREHAALAPMYLGVRAVIAKSFARIHMANLVNFGILPLTFALEDDYDRVAQGARARLDLADLDLGEASLAVGGAQIPLKHQLSPRDLEIVRAGGALAHVKARAQGGAK